MNRWTWPEEARRLSDWMGARALRAFTSDPKPTDNRKWGRRVWFEQGGKRRASFLERRLSQAGEPGKYQYRFVCGRSLKALYKEQLLGYALEVEEMGLRVYGFPGGEEGSPTLCVRSRYHPELPPAFKRTKGIWDSDERVWVWRDESRFDEVWAFLRSFYGFEDGRFFDVSMSLEALEPEVIRGTPLFSLGRQLLSCASDVVRAAPGVFFHDSTGAFEDLANLQLVASKVPTSVYERHRDELSMCVVGVVTHDPRASKGKKVRRRLERTLFAFPPEPEPETLSGPWEEHSLVESPFGSKNSFF